jgi:hypothetical protein
VTIRRPPVGCMNNAAVPIPRRFAPDSTSLLPVSVPKTYPQDPDRACGKAPQPCLSRIQGPRTSDYLLFNEVLRHINGGNKKPD